MANWKGYRITSPYGWINHPIDGNRSFHAGIDLVKSHQAPIPAFIGGEVLFAGMGKSGTGLGDYGNVVFLKDAAGKGHLYAHLDSVRVNAGQKVNSGDVVGTQGATGRVTGSHLHFEVRKRTSPSFGWTQDRESGSLNPQNYVDSFTQKGKTDNYIKKIQQFVVNEGFSIAIDGIAGPKTRAGLYKVLQNELNKQYNAGLKVDGIPGPKTNAKLVNVELAATGNITKVIQALLNIAGYYQGNLDGIFGQKTLAAIKEFQKNKNLTIDGIVGPNTWSELFKI